MELVVYSVFQEIWKNITLLLVIISAVLLVLTEILSTKYGKINLRADRTKLRFLAVAIGILALTSLILLIIILPQKPL